MEHVYIIAEAGVNHNGDIKLAKKLIEEAAKAGADAVKFQTFKADTLVTKEAAKADYQKKSDEADDSQYSMLKKLELSEEMHRALMECCKEHNIQFLSTGFDIESIEMLEEFNLPFIKIPSGEITNYPYLKKIGSLKRNVILSTGMADLSEVRQAVEVLERQGCKEIIILHCNTAYPTPFEDVNLRAMKTMEQEFSYPVGYSDHTLGIEVAIAAVAMGAKVIEKHFTLDKTMVGPDHAASLEPDELKKMVDSIRNIEAALGSEKKEPTPSERVNLYAARKSIVALRDIEEGEIFSEDNLAVKRPGNGISPFEWGNIIGTIATKDYKKDELIER